MQHDERWGYNEYVSYYKIRNKWPQLRNYRLCQGLYCPKDFASRKEFEVLVDIANNDSPQSHFVKCCDIVYLITKYRVANWPKPEEFKLKRVRYQDLTAEQKQKLTYLMYWLGINNKPRNPKYHAPIASKVYDGSTGSTASVRLTGTGRSWKPGEKTRNYRR